MELSVLKKPELVVAIDFGSTYSGYAWQWRSDFLKDRGNIHFNNNWGAGAKLHKTTTCVLLKAVENNDNGYEVESFGHEAERMYISKFKDNEDEKIEALKDKREFDDQICGKLLIFKRFKHLMYAKNFEEDMLVEDPLGQSCKLFEIVSKLIRALKDHFLKNLKEKGQRVDLAKTLWVVTVPAIWSDKAKSFMRKAAEKAILEDTGEKNEGVNKKKRTNVLLALEPEAAAIYCIHLPDEQRANMNELGTPGQVFLTADLGGLTADLSAVKVLEDGLLQEIALSNGELAGGQNVNDAFFQACHDSFQGDSWKTVFGKAMPTEMLEMEDDFEQKKVTIGREDPRLENIALKLPYLVMKEIESKNILLKDEQDVNQKFKLRRNEMMFNSNFVRDKLFKETCIRIFDIMKKDLKKDGFKECKTVVLVGGFAESPIAVQHIRKAVEENFPDMKVVVPSSPFQAVLKGAVLYGHDPMIFKSRIARYTYGVGTNILFDEKRHDEKKKWLNTENNKYYCKDVFAVHVVKGQSVILKEQLEEHKYQPMYKNQTSVNFSIYASDRVPMKSTFDEEPDSVMYTTDEGCKKIGDIEVEMPDTTLGTERNLLVRMVYGGTELSVIVKDETSGHEFLVSINFDTL